MATTESECHERAKWQEVREAATAVEEGRLSLDEIHVDYFSLGAAIAGASRWLVEVELDNRRTK
jgi:hypothetical protein